MFTTQILAVIAILFGSGFLFGMLTHYWIKRIEEELLKRKRRGYQN